MWTGGTGCDPQPHNSLTLPPLKLAHHTTHKTRPSYHPHNSLTLPSTKLAHPTTTKTPPPVTTPPKELPHQSPHHPKNSPTSHHTTQRTPPPVTFVVSTKNYFCRSPAGVGRKTYVTRILKT